MALLSSWSSSTSLWWSLRRRPVVEHSSREIWRISKQMSRIILTYKMLHMSSCEPVIFFLFLSKCGSTQLDTALRYAETTGAVRTHWSSWFWSRGMFLSFDKLSPWAVMNHWYTLLLLEEQEHFWVLTKEFKNKVQIIWRRKKQNLKSLFVCSTIQFQNE